MLHEDAVQLLASRGYTFVPFEPGVDVDQYPRHSIFYT